jgi:hypothetical protein
VSKPPEYKPVTDEQRARAAAGLEKLKRDMAEAAKRPSPPVTSPGKFNEPIGLDADGNFQPPLTEEEKAHNERVRRRAASGDEDERRNGDAG